MPRLIQSINKDEKAQKANKLLSIKLKCWYIIFNKFHNKWLLMSLDAQYF